jgi:bifunctional non-homologous end joining protein LigD
VVQAPSLAELQPMLLTERKTPFSDPGWSYELKFDGYRLMVEVDAGAVALKSRGGADATRWFPEVVAGLSALRGGRHVLDGEVCVLDDLGRADFDQLHARAMRRKWFKGAPPVVFCAFDAMVINGRDIMAKPLVARKAALRRLLTPAPAQVLYVAGIKGEGAALYEQAVALRLEGIVAKREGSPYVPGVRSDDWVKIKRPGATPAQRFTRA